MSTEAIEAAARAPAVAIAYGNIAFNIGKGRLAHNPEHTHKWTVFVRGAYGQDISYAVAKVVFSLHPSFPEPVREVVEPPYAVSETGWGAFEVGIEVHLRGGAGVVRLAHMLKLFADASGGSSAPLVGAAAASAAEKPVLSEHYDELVFMSVPDDAGLKEALARGPVKDPPPYPYAEHLTVFTPEADLAGIASARKWLADRTEELEERLSKARAAKAALQYKHLPDLGV